MPAGTIGRNTRSNAKVFLQGDTRPKAAPRRRFLSAPEPPPNIFWPRLRIEYLLIVLLTGVFNLRDFYLRHEGKETGNSL